MGSRKTFSRRMFCAAALVGAVLLGETQTTRAESIVLFGPGSPVAAGSTVSVLAVLQDNTTPLVSYSLDVNVLPDAGASGSVTGVGQPPSNFVEDTNLIEQDADDSLNPLFSIIAAASDGGVFFNALSASGTPVDLAIDGVSDALGEAFFEVSADALGLFTITLGPGTEIYDGASPVPFETTSLTIEVVPEPSVAIVLSGGLLMLAARRRRMAGR